MLEHQNGIGNRLLLVFLDGYQRLVIVRDGNRLALGSIGSCRGDVGKHVLDFLLNLVRVHITHDNQALQVRTIPAAVVGTQILVGEVHNDVHGTDGHAVGIAASREQVLEGSLLHTHHGRTAHTPLLIDNAALLVNLLVLQQQIMTPVMQNQQARVNGTGRLHIYIIYIIYCLVKGGVGVQVLAELHANALQILFQGIAGEVRGTVEAHVFQKVCQTALVLLFLNGAHLLRNVEVTTFLGPFIVADVVSKSVG